MDDQAIGKALDDLCQLFPVGELPPGLLAILNNLKMLIQALG